MMSKKMIKAISFILAGLMILSAVAVLVQVFAADGTPNMMYIPSTGDNDLDYIVPVAIIAAAVVLAVICMILPKLKKKQ